MSRSPTPHPERRPDARQLALLPPADPLDRECPDDPGEIVRVMEAVLPWALVWRGGTWHLDTCLDSKVNSERQGCSKKCQRMQAAFWLVQTWTERHPQARPDRRRDEGRQSA